MANIVRKKNKDNILYFQVNKKTKKGKYIILDKSKQHKYCEEVLLEGFDHLPSGFYTNDGFGLTSAGNFLLQEITNKYNGGKIELTITANGQAKLDGRGMKIKATVPKQPSSIAKSYVPQVKTSRCFRHRSAVRKSNRTDYRERKVFKMEHNHRIFSIFGELHDSKISI